MLKYTQRKLKNKAINYVDNYVPLGFTLGDFSESLKVDSPIKSIELDYNSNSNSNSDNDNDSQYDVQLYNRITTKILNHRRNHILEDVNNNSDSNADIDIDLDSEDTTIEFNIPSNNKFIIDNELFISGVSLLNISLNSDIILSNPTNIHRLVSQSISKIINSIVTDNNNNDIMNSIFSSLDDSIKLNILKLYLQDKQLTSQIIVEDSKDHTFPSQSLQELFLKLPLDSNGSNDGNKQHDQHDQQIHKEHDEQDQYPIKDLSWVNPSNIDLITKKIKENGKYILPLKQKKVSQKLMFLNNNNNNTNNIDLPNNYSSPNLTHLEKISTKYNISDSNLNILHNNNIDTNNNNTDNNITHNQQIQMDLLSDIDDANDIEQSSSPTIPVDSPSMKICENSDDNLADDSSPSTTTPHLGIQNNHFNRNKQDISPPSMKFQHNFNLKSDNLYQEKKQLNQQQSTFATPNSINYPVLATKSKSSFSSSTSLKQNISFNISTKSTQIKGKDTLNSPTPKEKADILKLLRDGIKEYSFLLTDFQQKELVKNRSDHLVSYLQKYGFNLKPKLINDYLGEIKKDKLDNQTKIYIQNENFVDDVKNLLIESERRRKCYNKRKNIKYEPLKKLSPLSISSQSSFNSNTSYVPISNNENQPIRKNSITSSITNSINNNNISVKSNNIKLLPKTDLINKPEKFKPIIISSVRIGSFINKRLSLSGSSTDSTLCTIADLKNIQKRIEDERYLNKLRLTNSSLKQCVDDIYGSSLSFTHSLAYNKIPLNLNHQTNINLENDQMISYVEVLLDVSKLLQNQNRSINSDLNYASILQLKSITRIYDNDKLIYRRCDPITGAFTKDNKNIVKIILPLQAKLWASLINNYHNGIINESKFSSLMITHTLFPNDDIIKFKTGSNAIYSFVWDFMINKNNQYSPHCINILMNPSKIPIQNSLNSNLQPQLRSKSDIQLGKSSKNHIPVVTPTSSSTSSTPVINLIPTPKQKHIQRSKTQLQQTAPLVRRVTTNNSSYNGKQYIESVSDNSINMNFNFGSNKESNMVTSTPLTNHSQHLDENRGHKRTRSRSMNEIDLMSLPISFDNLLNMPFLNAFSPTDSLGSPIVSKQNIPFLKSQNSYLNNNNNNVTNTNTNANISNSGLISQDTTNYNNSVDSILGSNYIKHQSQFQTITENKEYENVNANSQLGLNHFTQTFDDLNNPSSNPMITFSLDKTSTTLTGDNKRNNYNNINNNNNYNMDNADTINNNNNNNNIDNNINNKNINNTFKLPMDDITIYSSNSHTTTTISSAPALQTTFSITDPSERELAELASSLTGIPGINTP
ncbi:hypothetical protein C6P42_005264 [Pichia californica]|nr:hypothetical protein C6P42_005264 [[Candida] californica]